MAPETPATFDELVDTLVDWATESDRIRALWIEARTMPELRRPYRALELHTASDEPDYPAACNELEAAVARLVAAELVAVTATERFAREYRWRCESPQGRGGGKTLEWSLIAEQSHLLAKRPRAEVVPLVDKTTQLPHVLDYSLRARR